MDSTHSQIMQKLLKINLSILLIILFYTTFHYYNKLFSSIENVSQSPNVHLYIKQKEIIQQKSYKNFTHFMAHYLINHAIQHAY